MKQSGYLEVKRMRSITQAAPARFTSITALDVLCRCWPSTVTRLYRRMKPTRPDPPETEICGSMMSTVMRTACWNSWRIALSAAPLSDGHRRLS